MIPYTKKVAKQPFKLLCLFTLLASVGCAKTQAINTEKTQKSDNAINQTSSKIDYSAVYAKVLAGTGQCVAESKTSFVCDKDMKTEFQQLKEVDLDGNGTTDILAQSVTSGIGYNYSASELHMILMDNNKRYHAHHSLLMSSKGAYQTLDINNITQTPKGTRISATATLNDKNLDGVIDNRDANLTFIWTDGRLYEESYLNKCQLANMKDKRIFKDDVKNVKRYVTLDDLDYTQKQEETAIYHGNEYRAQLHGCDNLQVSFTVSGQDASVQKVLTDLATISRFKSVFNNKEIQAYKQQLNPDKESQMYHESWLIRVMHNDIMDGSTQRKTVTVQLVNRSSPEESESGSHWNVALRLK